MNCSMMPMIPLRTLAPCMAALRASLYVAMLVFVPVLMVVPAHAEESSTDKGKEVVGKIKATLYIGTNDDPEKLGGPLTPVDQAMTKRLRSVKQMEFVHYRLLGSDSQPVFRSYENWLSPLRPSEEILLSFESQGRAADGGLRLDLELWQHRRKVMKSDPVLQIGRPLLILGPKWRGGTLIIAVELMEHSF